MKRLFVFLAFALVFLSCRKGTFETVPTVKIESFGPKEVNKGQLFRLIATVTDNEGDVKDSSVLIVRNLHLNTITTTDTIRQEINGLGFPNNSKFELQVTFNYGELDDNTIFQSYDGKERKISVGLIVIDNAGNRSNYVESDQILLKKL